VSKGAAELWQDDLHSEVEYGACLETGEDSYWELQLLEKFASGHSDYFTYLKFSNY